MEQLIDNNKTFKENVSEIRHKCSDSELKFELSAKLYEQAFGKKPIKSRNNTHFDKWNKGSSW